MISFRGLEKVAGLTQISSGQVSHTSPIAQDYHKNDVVVFYGPYLFLVLLAGFLAWLLMCWLPQAPPPQDGYVARARARWLVKRMTSWLQDTPTFDGVLAGLEIRSVGIDGKVHGSITMDDNLISSTGAVHDGTLAILADTVTTFAQIAAGYIPGLTVCLGVSVHGQILAGERLLVESKVAQVHGTAMIVLEMKIKRPGNGSLGEDKVLVSVLHTKSLNAPYNAWLVNNFMVRCLPLAQLLSWFPLSAPSATTSNCDKAVSVENLLQVRKKECEEASQGETYFLADVAPRLQNAFGIGHGAAIAGLLASAARGHLQVRGKSGHLQELSATYMAPVPGDAHVCLTAKPQGDTKALGPDSSVLNLAVDLKVDGKVLSQCNLRYSLN